ncbi:VCBS repeat-containing protein [bacterium]|nr:VCBS repeat-containing protein [bacterium]
MNRVVVHCLAALLLLFTESEAFSQTFTDVTVDAGIVLSASMGNTVVWLDYDNDGRLDFYGNTNEFAFFYKNNGNGTFTNITTSMGLSGTDPASVAVADFDKDGYDDLLIVSKHVSIPVRIYKNMLGNNFQVVFEGQSSIERAIWLDFEGDGDLDIFCNTGGFPLLYLNDGEGNFTESAAGMNFNNDSGITAAAADMNNDGFTDIYACSYGSANRLYKNIAGGNVEDISFSAHVADYNKGVSQSWGDYNNDGFLDLYVSNIQSNRNILFKNLGNETFSDVTYDAGVADAGDARTSAWVDFNNDGLMDLFTTNHINENRLYQNNGNGTFTDVAEEWNIRNPEDGFGISWGDYDLDGDQDVLICGHTYSVKLLRNDGNNPGNYLDVELEGIFDNASGIGTRIEVYVGGQMTVQEVNGGRGARCQDALIAHFGLAAAAQADSLIVKWQSGMVQKLYYISANQLITIVQDAVGINDIYSGNELFELYPNPVKYVINLRFNERVGKITDVKIYSVTGQIVLSRSLKEQGNATVDVRELTRGWYYIMINSGHSIYYRPFIKK